jgi:hypothetical protein
MTDRDSELAAPSEHNLTPYTFGEELFPAQLLCFMFLDTPGQQAAVEALNAPEPDLALFDEMRRTVVNSAALAERIEPSETYLLIEFGKSKLRHGNRQKAAEHGLLQALHGMHDQLHVAVNRLQFPEDGYHDVVGKFAAKVSKPQSPGFQKVMNHFSPESPLPLYLGGTAEEPLTALAKKYSEWARHIPPERQEAHKIMQQLLGIGTERPISLREYGLMHKVPQADIVLVQEAVFTELELFLKPPVRRREVKVRSEED